MSVLAAAAAMGPSAATVPYGLCGGGARKRKDVVWEEEEEDDQVVVVPAPELATKGDEEDGLFVLETVEEEERSASTGAAGSDEEDEEAEVESSKETSSRMRKTKKCVGLSCLDALDDALPIKRGLSNFFSGKSRSFANLQDVHAADGTSAASVLAKPENPFNKRRRILRCSSIRRVSSTSLTALPPFLPPSSCTNTTIVPSNGGTATASNGAHGGDGD